MKALVRVDFNVPLDDQLQVTDDSRIKLVLPTIKELLGKGDSVILMSHLGRPKNREDRYSLRHVIPALSKLINQPVLFAEDCVSDETAKKAAELKGGEVLLLENLRFYPEEKNKDCEFARKLASLADYYVNDAFGVAHRKHASTYTITKFFNGNKRFGFLMKREIENLDNLLKNPIKPTTAILGGAKVSDKVAVIENLLDKVDNILIGGAMAYTFIRAQGGQTGNSLVETDRIDLAKKLMEKAKKQNVQVHLPVDSYIADDFSNDANIRVSESHTIPEGWMGLDIGPKALQLYTEVIEKSNTILWNGPMGVFEFPNFRLGTQGIAKVLAKTTSNGAFSMVGGGDSIAALEMTGLYKYISYISSGGGAMLSYLEGNSLPAIKAIEEDIAENACD